MKQKVYVAGPITKGGEFQNVHRALMFADELLAQGYIPFVPHLTCFWDMMFAHEYEEWMTYDDEWLQSCDMVLRTPGYSSGSEREVTRAIELGIPVYYSLEELYAAASAR